ncbi:hypothetical protein AAHB54_10900 [Bacillus cereus]
MGYRVEGEILNRAVEKEILSSPVTYGTIQIPNGGQPIILMADRQTTEWLSENGKYHFSRFTSSCPVKTRGLCIV